MIQSTHKNTQPPQLKRAQEKAHRSKAERLSKKQKDFALEFAKTGNGTQSALKVYDTTDYKTAGVIANENLAKPKIRVEILSLLNQNGIEMPEIFSTHKRNMLQSEHLPTSQKAVSDFYDILGMKDGQKQDNSVKVAFIIKK